jgi:Protein of unknown function (DUF732)
VPTRSGPRCRWGQFAVLVAGVALFTSACGGSGHSSQDAAENTAFLSSVHDAAPDIGTYRTDPQLVSLGHAVCEGFQSGTTYEQLADRLAQLQGSDTLPSQDLGAVIVASVENFCPKYTDQVS